MEIITGMGVRAGINPAPTLDTGKHNCINH